MDTTTVTAFLPAAWLTVMALIIPAGILLQLWNDRSARALATAAHDTERPS